MSHGFRVRYWVQDTIETGHWELSGLMSMDVYDEEVLAEMFRWYSQWHVVDSDEEY